MEVIAEREGPLPGPLDSLKLGKVLGRGGFAVKMSQGRSGTWSNLILWSDLSNAFNLPLSGRVSSHLGGGTCCS